MNQESKDPSDRRRMMRFNIPGAKVETKRPGTLFGLFGKGEDTAGEMLDISGLGLRFISKEKMTLETKLKLTVTFPQMKDKLECAGIVRWTHAHTRPGFFVVGVEFEKLTPEQQDLLEKLQKRGP